MDGCKALCRAVHETNQAKMLELSKDALNCNIFLSELLGIFPLNPIAWDFPLASALTCGCGRWFSVIGNSVSPSDSVYMKSCVPCVSCINTSCFDLFQAVPETAGIKFPDFKSAGVTLRSQRVGCCPGPLGPLLMSLSLPVCLLLCSPFIAKESQVLASKIRKEFHKCEDSETWNAGSVKALQGHLDVLVFVTGVPALLLDTCDGPKWSCLVQTEHAAKCNGPCRACV